MHMYIFDIIVSIIEDWSSHHVLYADIFNMDIHFNYLSHLVIMVEWLNITEVMTLWFCSVSRAAVQRHVKAGSQHVFG